MTNSNPSFNSVQHLPPLLRNAYQQEQLENYPLAYKSYFKFLNQSFQQHALAEEENEFPSLGQNSWGHQLQWLNESIEILHRMRHIAMREDKLQFHKTHNDQASLIRTNAPNSTHNGSAQPSNSHTSHPKPSQKPDPSEHEFESVSHSSTSRKPPSLKLKASNPLKYARRLVEYQEIQFMQQEALKEKKQREEATLLERYKSEWNRRCAPPSSHNDDVFQWQYTNSEQESPHKRLAASLGKRSSHFTEKIHQNSNCNSKISWDSFVEDRFTVSYERMIDALLLKDYKMMRELRDLETLLPRRKNKQKHRKSVSNDSFMYQELNQNEEKEYNSDSSSSGTDQDRDHVLNLMEKCLRKHFHSIYHESEHALNIVMSDFVQHFLIRRTLLGDEDDGEPSSSVDPYFCELMIEEGKEDIINFCQKLVQTVLFKFWTGLTRSKAKQLVQNQIHIYIHDYVFSMGIYKRLIEFYSHFEDVKKQNEKLSYNLQKFNSKGATLKHFGVPFKFQLVNKSNPYSRSISMLQYFQDFPTIHGKLNALTETISMISHEVEDYWKGSQQYTKDELVLAADDLIPIFSFVFMKSGVQNAFSHVKFLNDFIDERDSFGEKGYALTTMESLCHYLLNLRWDSLKMEYHRMLQEDEKEGRSQQIEEKLLSFEDAEPTASQDIPTNLDTEKIESKSATLQEDMEDELSGLEETVLDEDTLDDFL